MDNPLIEELAKQLRYHRDRYYNAEPEISDEEFDAIEARLRALDPDHAALAEVGAEPPTDAALDADAEAEAEALARGANAEHLAERLVAESARAYEGKPTDPKHYKALWLALSREAPEHRALSHVVPPRGLDWPKAQHELPMGSLNKAASPDELRDWATRCDGLAVAQEIDAISGNLSFTEKLDGLSLEVVYDGGRLEAAITRGDGVIGEQITPNVKHMQGVPEQIPHAGRISVRGEIILRKRDAKGFEVFKREVDPRFVELKSLRNTAAGIARTKDPKLLPGCRFLSVLFYDLEGVEGIAAQTDELAFIAGQGFTTPTGAPGDLEAILEVYRRYEDGARAALDYDIDGLVVSANDQHAMTMLGELNNRPRASVALKFGTEMQVTTLIGIMWSTGDTGRITPIAQIEPVFLAGAEIRQASLHNVAKVRAMKIGAGDQVLVSRRGDVIPYVEKVMIKGDLEEEAPATCRACAAPVTVEGEYLVCKNQECPARRLGRLKTWIRHLGLLDWGEKTLGRLFELGLVKEPSELYRLRLEDLTQLEGFAEVSAKRLLEPLNAVKQIPISTFIAALGIESVSKETGKLLARAGFDTFEAISAATVEALSEVEGLGAIKAEKILSGVRARLLEIERLAAVGVVPVKPEEGGPLAGLSFCFSGPQARPRKELALIVEKNGGRVASSVTKGVDYLVLADAESTSSKAQKAKKLGTQIIDGEMFERIVTERGGKIGV